MARQVAILLSLMLFGPVAALAQEPGAAPPKNQVPKPEMERPTVWGEPTEVRIRLYVIDIDGVDSANQSFSASVYLEANWNSPFLRHEGPGPTVRGLSDLWTPRLALVNQQQAWSAFPAAVEISPQGDVVYRQKWWGWFSQPLDLRDFPFDRQRLAIHLASAGQLESDVTIKPLLQEEGRGSGLAEKLSLPDFKVLSWKAEPRPYYPFKGERGNPGFVMEIEIDRQSSFYVWKIIFPLCLIVIMSFVPRWIDPKQIGTNIGIATTSFLTLVAYLFAITVLLPRVSYLTRMDQFILLSTLMVFVSLVQTVATTTMVKGRLAGVVAPVERWSRLAYPVAMIVVLAVSFVW